MKQGKREKGKREKRQEQLEKDLGAKLLKQLQTIIDVGEMIEPQIKIKKGEQIMTRFDPTEKAVYTLISKRMKKMQSILSEISTCRNALWEHVNQRLEDNEKIKVDACPDLALRKFFDVVELSHPPVCQNCHDKASCFKADCNH